LRRRRGSRWPGTRQCEPALASVACGAVPLGHAGRNAPGLTGVLHIQRELLAERGAVLGIQVDLIAGAPKANRKVSATGPPVRSSSTATVTFWATVTPYGG
jgi:hypothetical protein